MILFIILIWITKLILNFNLYIMNSLANNIDNNCISDYNFNQMGFYKPYQDATNKIDLMRYTNNSLSYGYNKASNKFYLCESPILEASIICIISEHENFESVRTALIEYKQNIF